MPRGKINKGTNKKITPVEVKNIKPAGITFSRFLNNKEQRRDLLLFLIAFTGLYFIISALYPYPDVFPDTGNYILSAKLKTIGGYRPVGYSWFLSFFHSVSPSIHFLFFAQFFLHVISTLLFIFTIKYLFSPAAKWLYYTFSFLIIISPAALYLTNYIMSDTIFNSLTLLFITSILWLIRTETLSVKLLIIVFHLVVLYLIFNVRYVALFYPLISIIFIISSFRSKITGIAISLLPVLVVWGAYSKTKKDMKKHIGIEAFSGFSGWAMANNAVSIIPYIDLKPEQINDRALKYIHSMILQFDDSVYKKDHVMETDFMWKNDFPGKQIFFRIRQGLNMNYVQGWVYVGELYNKYGMMLIKEYPFKFFNYFVFENIKQLFKYFDIPNPKIWKPDSLQKEWYRLDFDEYEYKYTLFADINPIVKITGFIRWILFFAALIALILAFRKLKLSREKVYSVSAIILFIFCYFFFSVFTHPVNNFRYLVPVYAFMTIVTYITANQFIHLIRKKNSVAKNNNG